MRRRYRQPLRALCLIAVFLVEHLPLSGGHHPRVHAVAVGQLRVHLPVVLGLPYGHLLVLVAVHVFHLFLVEAGGGDTLQTVALNGLADEARGIDEGHLVGRGGFFASTFFLAFLVIGLILLFAFQTALRGSDHGHLRGFTLVVGIVDAEGNGLLGQVDAQAHQQRGAARGCCGCCRPCCCNVAGNLCAQLEGEESGQLDCAVLAHVAQGEGFVRHLGARPRYAVIECNPLQARRLEVGKDGDIACYGDDLADDARQLRCELQGLHVAQQTNLVLDDLGTEHELLRPAQLGVVEQIGVDGNPVGKDLLHRYAVPDPLRNLG